MVVTVWRELMAAGYSSTKREKKGNYLLLSYATSFQKHSYFKQGLVHLSLKAVINLRLWRNS